MRAEYIVAAPLLWLAVYLGATWFAESPERARRRRLRENRADLRRALGRRL